MTSLLALALSCQMTQMMPDYYSAMLKGPNSRGTYNLVLTSKFYRAEFNYRYVLKAEEDRLIGYDKRKDLITLEKLENVGANKFTFELTSEKEGRIHMTCSGRK
jgi:hypothetical protein